MGYFIAYDNLFSTWLAMGNDFDVKNVRDALSDFDQNIDDVYKKVFVKIFNTLQIRAFQTGRDLRIADQSGEEAIEAYQEDSDGW